MDVYWCWPTLILMVLVDTLRSARTLALSPPQQHRPRDEEGDPPPAPDSCDWTIWDDTKGQKGVRNVIGRCTEGHIDWRHPYGAVRLLLQLPSSLHPTPPPSAGTVSTIQACFRAKSHFAITKISLETDLLGDNTSRSSSSSSSSQVSLKPLVILNQSVPHMERELCFDSPLDKPVGLFLEAQSDFDTATSGHVEIDYDIQRTFHKNPQRGKLKYDDMEDCRPCTDAEILQSVCSSDFVVQGGIDAVLHNQEAQESQVRVLVDKIHRQRHNVFKHSATTPSSQSPATSSLSEHSQNEGSERTSGGEVIVPHKCGIRKGTGDFLFMGRMRLKRALLRCAPRLEDFDSLWEEAVRQGVNPCTLD